MRSTTRKGYPSTRLRATRMRYGNRADANVVFKISSRRQPLSDGILRHGDRCRRSHSMDK